MKTYKGFSIAEIIIAIALFTLVFVSLIQISSLTNRITNSSKEKNQSFEEINNIEKQLISIRNNNWFDILSNSDGSNKYIELVNNSYVIKNGTLSNDGITSYFTIKKANRDSSGKLVTTGTIVDSHTSVSYTHLTLPTIYSV